MQLKVSITGAGESMESRRRSVTRSMFGDNPKEMSGWITTLRNFDGPEMPFDEMVGAWDDASKLMHVSKVTRQKRLSRDKHFDLRVRREGGLGLHRERSGRRDAWPCRWLSR